MTVVSLMEMFRIYQQSRASLGKWGERENATNVPSWSRTVDVAFAYLKMCLNQVRRCDRPVAHVILGESVCSVPIFG